MASGYFPARKHDEFAQELDQARGLIRSVIDAWYESRSGLNPEDMAQDQSYVDSLCGAEAAVTSCLRVDESDPVAVEAQVKEWERRQDDAEREADRWRAIRSKLKAKALLDAMGAGSNVALRMDGNKWCATRPDFVNLQESPAGFGDTREQAISDLVAHEFPVSA